MWALLRARLVLIIALPLARFLIHRLAVFAERRDARSAKLLRRADAAVTAVTSRNRRKLRLR
jgi:hypothetical protein